MIYKCNYDAARNIVETTTHGIAGIAELRAMFNSIAGLCLQNPSANIIIDHSELEPGKLSMDAISELSTLTAYSADIFKKRKCAHIVTRDIQFGLVRAWENMVEARGVTEIVTKVFKNRDEAYAWIKKASCAEGR